jgi:hypothetical protein
VTAPTPNAARAYRVLDRARAAGTLNMGGWAQRNGFRATVDLDELTSECGSTACLAGWTVADAGYAVDSEGGVFSADGARVGEVWAMAAQLLAISDEDAARLFYSTSAGVDRAVAEIFGPRPAPVVEMQPPPCSDHASSELGCPVCTAQRRAFYTALGRSLEADS